jgi:predicted RNA binding protein YcfA (HicA-like mRNA interferase family)
VLPGELDGKRVLRALARLGWRVARTRGSHRILRHDRTGGFLILAFHDTLSRNSVRRLLREAGIPEDEFMRAL